MTTKATKITDKEALRRIMTTKNKMNYDNEDQKE